MTRADSFAVRCELVADAFQSLAHFDPRLGEPTVPAAGWSEQVPRIVVASPIGRDVLIRFAGDDWVVDGGRQIHGRYVAGENLVESVATLLRGDYLSGPVAYSDWSGERS